jgi:hypothetical protein
MSSPTRQPDDWLALGVPSGAGFTRVVVLVPDLLCVVVSIVFPDESLYRVIDFVSATGVTALGGGAATTTG